MRTKAKLKVEQKSSQQPKEKPKERAEVVHAGHAAKWGTSPMNVGTKTKAKEKQKEEKDSRKDPKRRFMGQQRLTKRR